MVTRAENRRFESNLSKIIRPVTAIKSLRCALFYVYIDNNIHTHVFPTIYEQITQMNMSDSCVQSNTIYDYLSLDLVIMYVKYLLNWQKSEYEIQYGLIEPLHGT